MGGPLPVAKCQSGTVPSELPSSLGVISLSWSLSGKANTLVQLVIAAQDGGGLQAQPSARVNISIVEGTVSPPVFEQAQYFFTVPEDVPLGASVGAVRAQNPPGMGLSLCLQPLDPLWEITWGVTRIGGSSWR